MYEVFPGCVSDERVPGKWLEQPPPQFHSESAKLVGIYCRVCREHYFYTLENNTAFRVPLVCLCILQFIS